MTIISDDGHLPPGPEQGEDLSPSFIQVRKKPRKTTWPWLLAAMGVVIAVSLVAGATLQWPGTGSLAGDLGYGLGASILPAIVLGFAVYIVLYLAILKRSNRDNGTKYLAILIATALLSGTGMSILSGLVDREGIQVDRLQNVFDATYAAQEAQQTRLEAEVVRGDLEALLRPAALKRPGGYDRALAELERRRGLIDEAMAGDATTAADLRQAFGSAFTNPARREQAQAEFDIGYESRRAEVAAFWDSQHRLLDLSEAQLEFLRRVPWSPEGEAYAFHRQRDMVEFNNRGAEFFRLNQSSERELERLRLSRDDARRELRARLTRMGAAP